MVKTVACEVQKDADFLYLVGIEGLSESELRQTCMKGPDQKGKQTLVCLKWTKSVTSETDCL